MLDRLPPELLERVLDFLGAADLFFFRLVWRPAFPPASAALVQRVRKLALDERDFPAVCELADDLSDTSMRRAAGFPGRQRFSPRGFGALLARSGVPGDNLCAFHVFENYLRRDDERAGRFLSGLGANAAVLRGFLETTSEEEWGRYSDVADMLRATGLPEDRLKAVVLKLETYPLNWKWTVVAELEDWLDGFAPGSLEIPGEKGRAGMAGMFEALACLDRPAGTAANVLSDLRTDCMAAAVKLCPWSWETRGSMVTWYARHKYGTRDDINRNILAFLQRFCVEAGLPVSSLARHAFVAGMLLDWNGSASLVAAMLVDPLFAPNLHFRSSDFLAAPGDHVDAAILRRIASDPRPCIMHRLAEFFEDTPLDEHVFAAAFGKTDPGGVPARIAAILRAADLPVRSLANIVLSRDTTSMAWFPRASYSSPVDVGLLIGYLLARSAARPGDADLSKAARCAGELLLPGLAGMQRGERTKGLWDAAAGIFDAAFDARSDPAFGVFCVGAFLGMLGRRFGLEGDVRRVLACEPRARKRIRTAGELRDLLVGSVAGRGGHVGDGPAPWLAWAWDPRSAGFPPALWIEQAGLGGDMDREMGVGERHRVLTRLWWRLPLVNARGGYPRFHAPVGGVFRAPSESQFRAVAESVVARPEDVELALQFNEGRIDDAVRALRRMGAQDRPAMADIVRISIA